MTTSTKTIGILGGLGAAASAEMYSRLVRLCQARGAAQDGQFPSVVIVSMPSSNMDKTGIPDHSDRRALEKEIRQGIADLAAAGSGFVVPACNTIMGLGLEGVSLPVIDIIAETVAATRRTGATNICVLASASSRLSGLYRRALNQQGLSIVDVSDEEQAVLTSMIDHGIGGRQDAGDVRALETIVGSAKGRGAEAVILGCTELSLLADKIAPRLPVIDSLDVAVQAALIYSDWRLL